MNNLTTSQAAALDSLSPRLAAAMAAAGTSLSDLIDDLITNVNSGNFAITANGWDVDAIAKDGGCFAQDADNTTGLTFAWFAGRIAWSGTLVDYAADDLLLAASSTNYVEALSDGTIAANTTAFTAGRVPLWQIVTSSDGITSVTRKRPLVSMIQADGIVGSLLSAAGRTERDRVTVGTLSATGTCLLVAPPFAATLTGVRLVVTTTVATSDTDYWAFSAVNKGAAGSGTTAVLSTAATNTTKATGGAGLTNYVDRELTLHGTGANLVCAANDVIELTAAKSGSAANLVNLVVVAEWRFTG